MAHMRYIAAAERTRVDRQTLLIDVSIFLLLMLFQ
jgi:hypothetical protein